MKLAFIIILSVLLVALFVTAIVTICHENKYKYNTLSLVIGGFVCGFSYLLTILIPNKIAGDILSSIYYSTMSWILIIVFNFVVSFANYRSNYKLNVITGRIFIILTTIDTIQLLLNPIFHHAFTLDQIFTETGAFYCNIINMKLFYQLHLIYCYLIVALIIYKLIRSIINTPFHFRKKYAVFLMLFIVVIALNAVFIALKWKIDFSVLVYTFFALTVFFTIYYYITTDNILQMIGLLSEDIHNSLICFDLKGKCIYMNKCGRILFDKIRETQQIQNRTVEQIAEEYISTSWLGTFHNSDSNYISGDDSFEIDGATHYYYEEYQKIRDKKNRFAGAFLKIEDRTEETKALNLEKYKSSHDELTGVLNRESFFQKAKIVISQNPYVERYMIATNIKDFKLVNDLLGSIKGDEILKAQAEMLKRFNVVEGSVLGRIGADKFALLIPKSSFDVKTVKEQAEKELVFTENMEFKVHTFLGIYEIANPKEEVTIMYDKANLAIKKTEDDFEFNFCFYDTFLMDSILREKNIITDFKMGINKNEFQMYLQGQFDPDGKLYGAEALARWNHPVKGLLIPKDFFEVLENTGYVTKLDLFIWEEACKTLAEWKAAGNNHYISINLNAKDMYYCDVYKTLTSLVEKYDVSPSKLNLEITETFLLHDIEIHSKMFKELQNYGFKIEMDDFGAGYSSLNMLKDIDVDILKIDMEFLNQRSNGQRGYTIIASVIEMAKKLKMQVISEGVETEEQLKFLKENKIDLIQGYYFSKPIPLAEFNSKYLKEEK